MPSSDSQSDMKDAADALTNLLDAGVSTTDPRVVTLISLISLAVPPRTPPKPEQNASKQRKPYTPPVNARGGIDVVAARMAMEEGADEVQEGGTAEGNPFALAEQILRGRKGKFGMDDCLGNLDVRSVMRIRTQIAAYRRLMRGEKIPLELMAKNIKEGPKYKGAVVERRAAIEKGMNHGAAVLKLPDFNEFDLRSLSRKEETHRWQSTELRNGNEHIDVVQAHHDRLYADRRRQRLKERIDETDGKDEWQMDANMEQRNTVIIDKIRAQGEDKKDVLEESEEMVTFGGGKVRNVTRHDLSVVRDRTAVPISVKTSGLYAPTYETMLKQRERRLRRRVMERLKEVKEIAPTVSEDVRRQLEIEEKQLKLIGLQRRVRNNVKETMRAVLHQPVFTEMAFYKDGKGTLLRRRAPVSKANATMSISDMARLREQQKSRRKRRRDNTLNALLQHANKFRSFFHDRKVYWQKKVFKDMDKYFRDKSREEERRKKKEQMERLRALRSNNEDEYLELLKTTKNKRLIQLLKQTDEYLVQIGAQVERQKQSAREEDKENGSHHAQASNAQSLGEEGKEIKIVGEEEDELTQLKKRRNDYYTITHTISEKVHQPKCLIGGTLKPYQMEGLQWLVSLFNNNLNGILADEMGLGKTIQTLSLITYLVEVKRMMGPFLVIVPLSVMSNWVRELDAWAPSLVKVVYKGDPGTRKRIQARQMHGGKYNVLLTTYEFVVKDKNVLGKIFWKYIIMDEGHRMKNADCKLALTLGSKYRSRNRLLLTGTPLQNNMTELWALLNFLLPTIFSSAETFETWFNAPFQASSLGDTAELNEEENLLIISRLHQVLRPFMLRRLKTDVEAQLPDKVEIVLRCEMSVWQRVLYRQVRKRLGIAAGAGNVGYRSFNNVVMQLKKVCNHPYLFYNDEELMSIPRDFLVRASGKFELLEHCLRKLLKTGHRVLMFSQMTAALDYLEYFLYNIGMKYLRLDGTTKSEDRQKMLEVFNAKNSEYFCFLLSTRAGGLGLNLQTADTVIIFDSDWNPMMDLQAQDRAHRIGQTKEVRVYRLICAGSIEVKILERANRKLQIDAQVIQAGQFNNKSNDDDRKTMLKDLLRQQGEDESAANKDVTSMTEINKKLARSDEEFEIFQKMDEEDAAQRNGRPRLLMDEAELPKWVLKPEVEQKQKKAYDEINLTEHGRGRRKRKTVVYNDNLTEKEWTEAMEEEGDIENAIRRKRQRLNGQGSSADSSADDFDQQRESTKNPDQESATEREMDMDESPHVSMDEVDSSGIQERSSVTKLAPFHDPELHSTPSRRRRKSRSRGRKPHH